MPDADHNLMGYRLQHVEHTARTCKRESLTPLRDIKGLWDERKQTTAAD